MCLFWHEWPKKGIGQLSSMSVLLSWAPLQETDPKQPLVDWEQGHGAYFWWLCLCCGCSSCFACTFLWHGTKNWDPGDRSWRGSPLVEVTWWYVSLELCSTASRSTPSVLRAYPYFVSFSIPALVRGLFPSNGCPLSFFCQITKCSAHSFLNMVGTNSFVNWYEYIHSSSNKRQGSLTVTITD